MTVSMLSNAQMSVIKKVLNRRVDVLFRDPNPKLDEYCNLLLDHLWTPGGEFTPESWEAVLDEFRSDSRKVKDVI